MKLKYDDLREGFWEESFQTWRFGIVYSRHVIVMCVQLGLTHLCQVGGEDVKGQYLIFIGE